MSDTAFRLLESHQRHDALLRRAQAMRFVDPLEIVRLKRMKLRIKDSLAKMALDRAR